MLNLRAWLISPLLLLPLAAQDPADQVPQVLPDVETPLLPVDTITPVPPPELPYGAGEMTAVEMPKNLKIESQGKISGSRDGGVRYEGPGVKISGDNGMEAFADSVVVDFNAKTATLEGNVSVYQGNVLQRGEKAVYYYDKKFMDASGLRASLDPILLEAGKFTVEDRGGKKVYVGEDAGITTHDVEHPNFWVRSKKTTIYPGEKVVFKDLLLYAGDTPVFWLPYLSQPLDRELGYHFVPGARSNWGPYLLNTYGIMLGGETDPDTGEKKDQWLLSRWHGDLRAKRGLGVGVDFLDTRQETSDELTGLSFYYLHDLAQNTARSGVERRPIDPERYKVELKHRQNLDIPGEAKWRLDSNLTLLSDAYYLEDLDIADYRTNPEPDNTVGLYRRDETSLLSILGRFRLNDFYRADTRLPEVSLDQSRQPIFGLPLLHEGSISFGIIGERAPDLRKGPILDPLTGMVSGDPGTRDLLNQLTGFERELAEKMVALPLGDPKREAIKTQLLDSGYARFRAYQEFSMPLEFGGFFTLTPNAGLGYTRYDDVKGPVGSSDRTYLHVGAETAVKFSKNYGDIQNHAWGIDGFKHILQPYANWSLVSTDEFNPEGPLVDRLTPTTRPRPLDPTRFTAVDQMNSWNVVRLGVRNRLLTRRDQQSYEWLFMDTYIDGFIQDPEGNRNFSNLYNDVSWQPLPWMGLDVETQFPIASGGSGFNEFTSRLRFMPTENFEFSLGYRVLNGHPVLVDSDRVDLQSYFRLNENWGFGTRHVLELDDRTLEFEQYSLHRDLGNWVAGMGVMHRDNRIQQEYGVMFSLTLKDFPSISLPFEIDNQ